MKVNDLLKIHNRNIISEKASSKMKIVPGSIVRFGYSGKNVHDRKPLVYVVDKRGDDIRGFNLNYMKEYFVGMLLEEKEAPKSTSVAYIRKLKKWEFYQDAFRTYKKIKMSMIQEIDYLTNAEIILISHIINRCTDV